MSLHFAEVRWRTKYKYLGRLLRHLIKYWKLVGEHFDSSSRHRLTLPRRMVRMSCWITGVRQKQLSEQHLPIFLRVTLFSSGQSLLSKFFSVRRRRRRSGLNKVRVPMLQKNGQVDGGAAACFGSVMISPIKTT